MIQYVSTRGQAPVLGFADAALTGLARDGGLYVPDGVPDIPLVELENMGSQNYLEIAWRVMAAFTGADVPSDDLIRLLQKAYRNFDRKEIAPLHQLDDKLYVQELFHGPTLAFKDIALQFLGQVFDYILAKKKERVTIVAATSGDTGSAAIEAFRDSKSADIVVLHPKGRVSEVQRRQMTTVLSPHVFNIAVEGSFDDCQDLVKAMFNDAKFRDEMNLSAVNSINWARIMAQAVYYVYAAARVKGPVAFSVPTGNFGNVYAGYIARMMGAPVEKLIVATNRNDILHRFFTTGRMQMAKVTPTSSPSMDIQVSSNFERFLFDLYARKGFSVAQTMRHFRDSGPFQLDAEMMTRAGTIFASGRQDDDQVLATIRRVHGEKKYLVDPHTAVGLGVAEEYRKANPESTVVSLATAHPAKFPDVVKQAVGLVPELPPHLSDLYEREERCAVLPLDLGKVQDFIRRSVKR